MCVQVRNYQRDIGRGFLVPNERNRILRSGRSEKASRIAGCLEKYGFSAIVTDSRRDSRDNLWLSHGAPSAESQFRLANPLNFVVQLIERPPTPRSLLRSGTRVRPDLPGSPEGRIPLASSRALTVLSQKSLLPLVNSVGPAGLSARLLGTIDRRILRESPRGDSKRRFYTAVNTWWRGSRRRRRRGRRRRRRRRR